MPNRATRPLTRAAVDAHHHAFASQRRYAWMTGDYEPLAHGFEEREYRSGVLGRLERMGVGVQASVLVQAAHDEDETAWLLRQAATAPRPTGVVAWIDLAAPDVDARLNRLLESPEGTYLVGVRHQVHDEPDPLWLLRPAVQHGLGHVAAHGLPFDLLVRSRELDAAIELAIRIPQLSLVLNHAGKPPLRTFGRDGDRWAEGIIRLARSSQVRCKLSGLATEGDLDAGRRGEFSEEADEAIVHVANTFGLGRLMYGSDWPVCSLAGEPDQHLAWYLRGLEVTTDEQGDRFLRGTALETYCRLSDLMGLQQ